MPSAGSFDRQAPAPAEGSIAYVYLISLVAAVGGLLFGYDTAVISGGIKSLKAHFSLDEIQKGWAVASILVGCMIGAACAGPLGDRIGRKKVLVLAAVMYAISGVASALPRCLSELAIARMIGGLGVGAAALLSPLYIAEIAPARIRGRLVSVNQLAIVGGILLSYFVNAVIAAQGDAAWNVETGWRWMLGFETLPACIFFCLILIVPESPRWLAKQGRRGEALAILSRIGGTSHADKEIRDIEDAISREEGTIGELFRPGMRLVLLIGIVLAVLQQITGINAVLYYAPTIFESAASNPSRAMSDTVAVGIVNLVFTLVAIGIVDRLGRKPLLLIGSFGMGISLALLGYAFVTERFGGLWVLLCVLSYVAFFAVAMGPVVWVVLSEIFPTRVRGRAMAIATFWLWVADFGVAFLFPVMFLGDKGPGGGAFFFYAAMCAVTVVFVAIAVPETKGKTLEEIERRWFALRDAARR